MCSVARVKSVQSGLVGHICQKFRKQRRDYAASASPLCLSFRCAAPKTLALPWALGRTWKNFLTRSSWPEKRLSRHVDLSSSLNGCRTKFTTLTLWRPLLPYGYSYTASLPDRVKPSFVVIFGHSDAQGWASECPDVKNYKWRLNPVSLALDAL